MKFESYPVEAFGLKIQCVGCGTWEFSEMTKGNSQNASTRAHAEKDFARHLEERGFNIVPPMCKECCDNLVLERVGSAFKDSLKAKAGDSHELHSNE